MTQKRFKTYSNVEERQHLLGFHRQLVSEIDIRKTHDSKVELAKKDLRLRANELLCIKRADRESRAEELKICNTKAQSKIEFKVSELHSTHIKFTSAAKSLNRSLNEDISALKIRLVIGIHDFGSFNLVLLI
jgi:hypothetical protein